MVSIPIPVTLCGFLSLLSEEPDKMAALFSVRYRNGVRCTQQSDDGQNDTNTLNLFGVHSGGYKREVGE